MRRTVLLSLGLMVMCAAGGLFARNSIPNLQLVVALVLLAGVFGLGAAIFVVGTRLGARLAPNRAPSPVPAAVPIDRPPTASRQLPETPVLSRAPVLIGAAPVEATAKTTVPQMDLDRLRERGAGVRKRLRVGGIAQRAGTQVGAQVSLRRTAIEWGILLVAVYAFCSGFLDLGTRNPLRGTEAEIFQALDWVLVNSLRNYGQFPQWNPYILTGLPYVADPFLHLYNPLVTLPVLVMGVWDGYKVGIFLSFVAAAVSAWYLGKVIGIGSIARLWLALGYAFTGRAVAQFLQGQYELVFGFAWIPLCLAGLIALYSSRRPFHLALTAVAFSLLFLSGNVYYTFYMMLTTALFTLVALVRIKQKPFRPFLDVQALRLIFTAGVLALLISSIQLLPLVELWPQLNKPGDPELKSSHTLNQIWLDYTSTEVERTDTKYFSQETYSYIGYVPFLGFALLPLAWLKQRRRVLVFLLLLFGLSVLWANLRETPLSVIYERYSFFHQFRYPTRFLLFGALALLAVTALGFDSIFKFVPVASLRTSRLSALGVKGAGAAAAAVVSLGLMLWSAADVYAANKGLAITFRPYETSWDVARAFYDFDSGPAYVQTPYLWSGALVSNELRNLGIFYGFSLQRNFNNLFNKRPVNVRANYFLLDAKEQPPFPDARLEFEREGVNVFRLTESLPFAFVAPDAVLRDSSGELKAGDVLAVNPDLATPNSLQFRGEFNEDSTLVVLTPRYSGWRAYVDGNFWGMRNVDGWLAVPTQSGAHTYRFEFDSTPFKLGIVISLIALSFTVFILGVETLGVKVPRLSRWLGTAVL